MATEPPCPLPDAALLRMVQDGWDFARIADAWARAAGSEAAESTVLAALSRATLSDTTGAVYRECLPWRVRPEHQASEPARLLRLLGRRRAGLPLPARIDAEIDRWLASLSTVGEVVAYDPETGFSAIAASDSRSLGIPISPPRPPSPGSADG